MTFSTNFLWVTFNMFNCSPDCLHGSFVRSVVFRLPIDPMVAGSGFSYTYWTGGTLGFTNTPVQGAGTRMFLGTHVTTNKMRIFWNDESSTTLFSTDSTLRFTWNTNAGVCPAPDGTNWCNFGDARVQGGVIARWGSTSPYSYSIIFFWDVAQSATAGFPYPYIEAARFSSGLAYQSRPLIWNPILEFRYPGVAPNARGDIGGIVMVGRAGTTGFYPSLGIIIYGDYDASAPPGWEFYYADFGTGATKRMGDFQTTHPFGPSQYAWISAGYVENSSYTGITHIIIFGRARDQPSVTRWWSV
jgi:hypothetical protein